MDEVAIAYSSRTVGAVLEQEIDASGSKTILVAFFLSTFASSLFGMLVMWFFGMNLLSPSQDCRPKYAF